MGRQKLNGREETEAMGHVRTRDAEVTGDRKEDVKSGRNKIHLEIKSKANCVGQMRPPRAPNGQNIFPTLLLEWETLIARDTLGIDRGNSRN